MLLEQTVLAGMMNDEQCFYEGISQLSSNFFNRQENQRIFEQLTKRNNSTSAEHLTKELDDQSQVSAIQIIDSNWTNYNDFFNSLKEVKKLHKKRQLYYSISKLQNRFDDADVDELIDSFINEIYSQSESDNKDEILYPEEFATEMLSRFHEITANPELSMGVPFSTTDERGRVYGIPSLDKTFNGAKGGDLIMIAAKTGVGKTAFAVNLARIFSMRQDYTGYYLNTEMSKYEMNARMLSAISRVDANEIETSRFTGTPDEIEDKKHRIIEAHQTHMNSNFVVSVVPDLPMYKLRGLVKQVKMNMDILDYIIVDYVGRMQTNSFQNLWDELYDITKNLKQLAIEMDIPIFMLAQRNQAGDVEGAKKMMNECDGVLFFEPVSEDDEENINNRIRQDQRDKVNYRILKKKVRRNDNEHPIYCMFNKARSEIVEAKEEFSFA